MTRARRRIAAALPASLAIATFVLAAPGLGEASPPVPDPAEVDASTLEARELHAKMQTIGRELTPVREKALQNEKIAKQQDELRKVIDAAMLANNPQFNEQMARLRELRETIEAPGGPPANAQELVAEGREIGAKLQKTQQAIMEDGQIPGQIDAFQAAVEAEMKSIDPKVGPLLAERDEIVTKLQTLIGPAAAP